MQNEYILFSVAYYVSRSNLNDLLAINLSILGVKLDRRIYLAISLYLATQN